MKGANEIMILINEKELLKILKDGKCLEETINKAISFIEEEKEIRKPWTSDKTAEPSTYLVSTICGYEPIGIVFGEENAKAYCDKWSKNDWYGCGYKYAPISVLNSRMDEEPKI